MTSAPLSHLSPGPSLPRKGYAAGRRGDRSRSAVEHSRAKGAQTCRKGGGVLFSLLLCLLLAACGSIQIEVERTPTPDQGGTATVAALQQANRALTTQVATLAATGEPRIGPETDSETLRKFLLTSYRNWKTLWVDARVIDTITGETAGAAQEKRIQVWISQPDKRFRLLTSSSTERVEAFTISDGKNVRLMDAETGQVQNRPLDPRVFQSYQPSDQPGESDAAHPLASEISSPIADLLFPSSLALSGGSFRASGLARLAGRDALVVEYTVPDRPTKDRLWVDRQTGVILRWVSVQKGGKPIGIDIFLTDIQIDVPIPASLFNLQVSEIPQFAQDYTGAAQVAAGEQVTPVPTTTTAARLYFYTPSTEQEFQLVRLPGQCLLEGTTCPSPEVVPGQPKLEGQPYPLLWSLDGRHALLPVMGQVSRLYLYTLMDGGWKLLVEAQQLDAAAWSPDGRWFVYSALKDGRRDIYLSNADGAQVRNLTAGKLTDTQANLAHLAWQGPARLLFAASGASGTQVYTLDIENGQMTPIEDLAPKNGLAPLPSPDGRLWAWVEQNDSRTNLLVGTAGTSGRIVAGFTQSTIWPLVWSPDGNWLAFGVYGGPPGSESADLFVTGADGSGMLQLYRSPRILDFTWVTGSQQLVVEADDGSGYSHLFLVDLNGGYRLLQAPGLRLDASWTAPSWGPG